MQALISFFIFVDSSEFIGDGEYHLDAMKKIETTESYLGLDQDVRGCQNEEPFDNCTTRLYIDTLMEQCGCLPFSIRLPSNKVPNYDLSTQKYDFQEPLCTANKLDCVKSVKVETSSCTPSCSGLILASFSKVEFNKNLDSLIPQEIETYNKYKKLTPFPTGFKGKA